MAKPDSYAQLLTIPAPPINSHGNAGRATGPYLVSRAVAAWPWPLPRARAVTTRPRGSSQSRGPPTVRADYSAGLAAACDRSAQFAAGQSGVFGLPGGPCRGRERQAPPLPEISGNGRRRAANCPRAASYPSAASRPRAAGDPARRANCDSARSVQSTTPIVTVVNVIEHLARHGSTARRAP